MFTVNAVSAVTLGASATATALTTADTTVDIFGQLTMVLKGISAGTEKLSMVDLVVFNVVEWRRLTMHERLALACSICFCFRKVISFHNAERLIRMVRLRQICMYFKDKVWPSLTSSKTYYSNVREFMELNESYLEKGMEIVRVLLRSEFTVRVNEAFTIIRFNDFEYRMSHLFRIELGMIANLLHMLWGILPILKDTFFLMRNHFDDESILKVVCKYVDSLGGERMHLELAINQFIQFFNVLLPILNETPCLIDSGIVLGKGHRFTIGSAFKTFVTDNKENATPLIKALVEMNPREAEQLNALRDRVNIQEDQLFKWISEGTHSSQDMLSKARFLLSIDDLCTEQSLRITDFKISRGTIEVESLFEVDPKLMNRIALDKHGGWASLKCPVRATR